MSKGYIPDKVVFYTRATGPYAAYGQTHTCTPAFPVADQTVTKDGKTLKNAKAWTLGNWRFVRSMDVSKVWGHRRPNTPKDGYRVVSAEQRGEGGRAWKVISPEGYLVDLREDVFLPILLREGLPKTGMIPAKLQWCQSGSQLRLEEVGSEQHKLYSTPAEKVAEKVQREVEKKARPKKPKPKYVPLKDLEVGGVYTFESWGMTSDRIYMGRVRYRGKLKTVWLPMVRLGTCNRTGSNQAQYDHFLKDRLAELARMRLSPIYSAIMATGSKARLRRMGDVIPPDNWRDMITKWERTDGYRVGYDPKRPHHENFDEGALEWP